MGAVKEKIARYLSEHQYCVLCTGSGDEVRATPVRYGVAGFTIVIYSEKFTRKFAYLKKNPAVALALHASSYPLSGLQVWGTAEVITATDPRHAQHYFEEIKRSEKLQKACRVLNLILVVPRRMVLLEQIKGKGYWYSVWEQDARGREKEREIKTIRELSRLKK
jgi:general stress protein 26